MCILYLAIFLMLVTTTFTMPRCGMLGFDITAALIISILSVIWKSLTETREIVWKDEDVLQLYTDDVSETTEVRIIWMHKRCLSIDCLTLYSASWSILIAFNVLMTISPVLQMVKKFIETFLCAFIIRTDPFNPKWLALWDTPSTVYYYNYQFVHFHD